MRARSMAVWAGLLLAIPAAALVMNANISGNWTLTVVDPTHGCEWVGPLSMAQNGGTFMGSGTVKLVPGSSDPCPPSLSGSVSGTISGFAIEFGLAVGFATASFEGTVGSDESTASGVWMIPAAFDGTWHAERVVGVRAPALNASGLAGLFVLLLAGGVCVLRRRVARAATR